MSGTQLSQFQNYNRCHVEFTGCYVTKWRVLYCIEIVFDIDLCLAIEPFFRTYPLPSEAQLLNTAGNVVTHY